MSRSPAIAKYLQGRAISMHYFRKFRKFRRCVRRVSRELEAPWPNLRYKALKSFPINIFCNCRNSEHEDRTPWTPSLYAKSLPSDNCLTHIFALNTFPGVTKSDGCHLKSLDHEGWATSNPCHSSADRFS